LAKRTVDLDLVLLVGGIDAAAGCLESQSDVEVVLVVGRLHADREIHRLRCALGLEVLAGETLHVEVEAALLFVATDAAFALVEARCGRYGRISS
jgi:hypothetical protein